MIKFSIRNWRRLCLNVRWVAIPASFLFFAFIGCDIRNSPSFRREAERQKQLTTDRTRAAIKNSPDLEQLDRFCSGELPQLKDAKLVMLDKGRDSVTLYYHYETEMDFTQVTGFYGTFFTDQKWETIAVKKDGWGPRYIEYQRVDYRIRLEAMLDSQYTGFVLACTKLEPGN